jgi:predicted RNA-binding protein YlqC (UPF0109 family)
MIEVLVTHPGAVKVTTKPTFDDAGREVIYFDLDVHPSDRGRPIGKGGAHMRSLRLLVNSAAYVQRVRYRLNSRNLRENEFDSSSVSKSRSILTNRR